MANGEALTDEGRKKLEEELAWREGEHRTEIVERIKVARDFGDLSENSEFDDAKEEQAKNEARIREIRNTLAQVAEFDAAGILGATLGSTVTVVDADGEIHDFTLVGSRETNSLENRISMESRWLRLVGHEWARPSRSCCRPARRVLTPLRRSRARPRVERRAECMLLGREPRGAFWFAALTGSHRGDSVCGYSGVAPRRFGLRLQRGRTEFYMTFWAHGAHR